MKQRIPNSTGEPAWSQQMCELLNVVPVAEHVDGAGEGQRRECVPPLSGKLSNVRVRPVESGELIRRHVSDRNVLNPVADDVARTTPAVESPSLEVEPAASLVVEVAPLQVPPWRVRSFSHEFGEPTAHAIVSVDDHRVGWPEIAREPKAGHELPVLVVSHRVDVGRRRSVVDLHEVNPRIVEPDLGPFVADDDRAEVRARLAAD